MKAGQRFALVAEDGPLPSTDDEAGHLHMEFDTNVDTRFPAQRTIVPGLIRDTKVYFERVLANRNLTEFTLNVNPIAVAHRESLIALYAMIRKPDGHARLAGTILLHPQRALDDGNDYAMAGHWGSDDDETLRWDPASNKIVLRGGPVSVQNNDVIEAWVEHYL